jgi:23S rRNA pseudouridine1911/1915/1917 synthase
MPHRFVADPPARRLDAAVAAHFSVSAAAARRLIEAGLVRVNGRPAKKGDLVSGGDLIEAEEAPLRPADLEVVPEPGAPLVVLYEDRDILALEKPSGAPSHPLRAGERGTLANALVARYPECVSASTDPREGGLCHRLDAETSGVCLAARTRAAYEAARAAFSAHAVEKTYLAVVGSGVPDALSLSLPLAHAPGDRRRVVAVADPREAARLKAQAAETRAACLARAGDLALVRAATRYGRMHQVRAHLAAAGAPLVGDALYGGRPGPALGRPFFLHAESISLAHPATGAPLSLSAPPPEALAARFGEIPPPGAPR